MQIAWDNKKPTHRVITLEKALPQEVVLQPCLDLQPLKLQKAQLQSDRLSLVVLWKDKKVPSNAGTSTRW